jgi:ParB-like chromosome segregation protein Spo0J
MKRAGLLEPIIVDHNGNGYRLVAGERRLKAARLLKWKTIAAHQS